MLSIPGLACIINIVGLLFRGNHRYVGLTDTLYGLVLV